MKYIKDLSEGARISETYLCKDKQTRTTKAGKPFDTVTLMDKTGTIEGKIWEVGSPGIAAFESGDFIEVIGDVQSYNGTLQLIISRVIVMDESRINISEYMPHTTKDVEEMYSSLLSIINSIKAPYMTELLNSFFVDDADFIKKFKNHSAAKSVHHGFMGGLLEHTLGVAENCVFFANHYPFLDRDLLITAAILHDVGKIYELSEFPENDYTDAGNLMGHIVIGCQIVANRCGKIADFPKTKSMELQHCILAHHGELEYGSPKKPALAEAMALSFADNLDAKMETFLEATSDKVPGDISWLGFSRVLDTNIRKTSPKYE